MTKAALIIILLLLIAGIASAQDEPDFEPGNPTVLDWSVIKLDVFWPWSKTLRGDEWLCLVQVQGPPDYQYQTLTLRGQPGPENEHVTLRAIHWFGPGRWTVRDGSCFIVYNGAIRYTSPIYGLPHVRILTGGSLVFLPGLSAPGFAITKPENE